MRKLDVTAVSLGSDSAWAAPTRGALLVMSCPSFDLGAQPELRPAAAEIDHRTRHVLVAGLVLAHGVAVRQPKNRGDSLRIDEVINVDFASHTSDRTHLRRQNLTHGIFLSEVSATLRP